MSFNIRAHIISQPMKTQDIATPFWSAKDEQGNELVDGHIAFQDVPGDELQPLQIALAKQPTQLFAAILCKSLINKDTGERLFSDTDRDVVAKLGGSIQMHLIDPLQAFLGLNTNAIEEAKKNLLAMLANATGTPSPNGSDAPSPRHNGA